MKLQGGTLVYALAVSLIIGMITASVLLNEHYNRLLIHNDAVREEVVRNANSGIQYLCGRSGFNEALSTEIDLFGRGKDSVRVVCKPWGVYDVLLSTAHTGRETFTRIAIAGNVPEENLRYALWLGDMDRPLRVCGKTELHGKCFLPKAGVERTYIEGKSYSGREFVHGTIAVSERCIPKVNEQRCMETERLLAGELQADDSLVTWQELTSTDSAFCSFNGPACVVNEKMPLVISNIYLEGQIRICSGVAINVERSATLVHVLLVAPEVRIAGETEGTFQVIARDSIVLGENVRMDYPSSLCLFTSRMSPLQTGITLHEGCTVNGELFATNSDPDIRRKLLVDIRKTCSITGSVYCNGLVDLKGTIQGAVTCQKFILTTNSAVYENTLLDAAIDNTQEPAHFGGNLYGRFERKEVVAWPD